MNFIHICIATSFNTIAADKNNYSLSFKCLTWYYIEFFLDYLTEKLKRRAEFLLKLFIFNLNLCNINFIQEIDSEIDGL